VYCLFGIRPSFDETYSKGGSILWGEVNYLTGELSEFERERIERDIKGDRETRRLSI